MDHPSESAAKPTVLAKSMRAIIHTKYGTDDALTLREVPKPEVGDDEILIRVLTAAVNKGDWHLMTGKPYLIRLMGYGVRKPKQAIFGQELAGRVEAIGKNVTKFQPGDEVFGKIAGGAFAESVCVSESKVVSKPATVSFEQAAATPVSGLTALQGLRDIAKVQPGQKVLINGASGGVGTFAVQLAKYLGAEVTGVCSTRNVEVVRELGADHVIDYTETDFTKQKHAYDVIFDIVGNRSLSDNLRALKPKGVYVGCAGQGGDFLGPIPRFLRMGLLSLVKRQGLVSFVAKPNPEDLTFLAERLAAGDIQAAISQRWDFDQVAEALRVSGTGRTQGKMVIRIGD